MPSMCDKLEMWDHMTPDNRLDAIQDFVAHMAVDYDVPVPQVISGVPDFPETPEDDSTKAAAYDPNTNTLYVNENVIADPESNMAMHEAAHEFAHELFAEYYSDDDTQPGESEAYARDYADQLQDEMQDYCDNPPPPQSPGQPDANVGDWNLPEGDGAAYV